MRTFIILMTGLLVAAAMPGSIALAADDDSETIKADTETIKACLAAERKSNRDGRDCIGRISDPCLKEPGRESTMSMVSCMSEETTVWDGLLNAEYKSLLGLLEDKAAESVRKAQRAWIAARDADCSVPDAIYAGGTTASLDSGKLHA